MGWGEQETERALRGGEEGSTVVEKGAAWPKKREKVLSDSGVQHDDDATRGDRQEIYSSYFFLTVSSLNHLPTDTQRG